MRRVLILLALVTGALAPVAGALADVPPDASPGSIGIRLLEAPVDRQDDPRARIYIIDHIDLGGSIQRRIEVSNTTDDVQRIAVYATGASIADGSFIGSRDRIQNELSTWTTLDQDLVELEPDSAGVVTVSVAVPDDAAPGEQYAVIWAEVRSVAPAGGGITAVNRVGIRMYVDVGGDGEAPSAFTITSLTASRLADGSPQVEATVTNTGGRALDLGGTLTLANGPGGLSAGPFDVQLGTTLGPGDIGLVTMPLDAQLPNGPWDARIELVSGLLSGTAEGTITFPDAGAAEAVPVTSTTDGFPPWGFIAVALGLLAMTVAVLWFLRRRRDEDHAIKGGADPLRPPDPRPLLV